MRNLPPAQLSRVRWGAGGLLALIAVGFWWPSLAGGRVPAAGVYQRQMPPFGGPEAAPERAWDALLWDSVAQFYPWRQLLHRGLSAGELPLWNPHQYCGYPFVGNGQSALFYPPNWLLAVLPADRFLGVSLALHWLLAGLFTLALARRIGLGWWGALLAAVVYQNSGFMITWALLPTVVNVMTWLPAAWLGVELIMRGRRAGLPLLAGALGLALLAGHLQFAAYVWLATGMYAAARVAYCWVRRRSAPVPALLLAVGLGLGLGLPQVLPSLELARHSPRGVADFSPQAWEFQRMRALQPVQLLTFVWPEALGDPVRGEYPGLSFTEHCGYAGALAVVLALLGVALRRDRWAALLGLGALLALSVAMAGPAAQLLYRLAPQLGLAGGFSRILGVYTLCLALLAGRGAHALGALLRSRPAAAGRRRAYGPLVLGAGLIALLLIELLPWGWRFLPLTPREQVYPQTALTATVASLTDSQQRSLMITPRAAWDLFQVPRALLPPNADTAYGLRSPQGYDSLALRGYREAARRAEGAEVSPVENGNMMLLENPASPLLREAAVHWIGSLTPLEQPHLELHGRYEGVYLYRHREALPRVRLEPASGAQVSLPQESLNTLAAQITAPGGSLVVADAYYPGWRAYVDRRPVELQAAGVFRQVQVPSTGGRVWMAYYPATVVVGLFAALISLALLTGLWTGGRPDGARD